MGLAAGVVLFMGMGEGAEGKMGGVEGQAAEGRIYDLGSTIDERFGKTGRMYLWV